MTENRGVENFADYFSKYILRPGFKSTLEKNNSDISVFKNNPILFCDEIMTAIKESTIVRFLVHDCDHDEMYLEHVKYQEFNLKNSNGDLLLIINIYSLLDLVVLKEINSKNILFQIDVGVQLSRDRIEFDNFVIFRNKYNNDSSKQDLEKVVNHFKYVEFKFEPKETDFLKMKSIKSSDDLMPEFNIIELIEVGHNLVATSKYIDSTSLEYIYFKFKNFWSNNNIDNIEDLDRYVTQYEEMKKVTCKFEAKQNLHFYFYAPYKKISFMLSPDNKECDIVGFDFTYKHVDFDVKHFLHERLIYSYPTKFQHDTGYLVSDLMKAGKDLWTQIKMLNY
jgi:hypothetical protein